jgi:RNase P/RNase MRP subunit POP5
MNAVWGAVTKLYGEVGASQTGLSLIDYDQQKKTAIIRVGHKALDMVRASLASITQMSNKPAAVHVLTVSGTIKALKKKAKL